MDIIEQRVLRGPNRWSQLTCLQTIVDAEQWVQAHGLPQDAASLHHLKSLPQVLCAVVTAPVGVFDSMG